ncbi:MAG: type II toxin-antitoxin system RelE/ParE family toxin [Paludibacter sp.]|nr:type II toxin-antitoxin system RelE/ParE family toxin [Paludibacter sp.]
MQKYDVKITNMAFYDIASTHDYIAYELFEPITADKYIRGIYDTIKKLAFYGASVAVSENEVLLKQYGSRVRNVKYKKMAIIYTIEEERVIIQRIKAGALIF